ncbi:ABC transporter permease [Sphingosinicella sp. LY1275]|uniref:ABC transporter permease n=1 Tax=Sphingosinicella sp. LY1275 TaxID=3095379 RepID=UPI002ADEE066|nr:ABC transporter permease [Sphingosinicella sp. LY1275]MEA1014019.1 ABC transporter permease [Sphingosinicella sp. LY1275]
MWRNYLTVGIRALAKNKTYAFINIFGLALGLAACLMILLFVRYELSFDKQLPGADQAFQFQSYFTDPDAGEVQKIQMAPYVARDLLKKDFPQVENSVHALSSGPIVLKGGQAYATEDFRFVDGNLLDILQFPLVKGNRETALNQVGSLVITETEARKYFGNDDPMGQTLTLSSRGKQTDYRVTGVLKDLPKNTHFRATMIARYDPQSYWADQTEFMTQWGWQSGWVYVKLRPGADADAINAQMEAFEKRNIPDQVFGGQRTNQGDFSEFKLVNIADVHLGDAQEAAMTPGNDRRSIITFGVIAALILAMACVNFTNLATARASQRAREVALRKVLGANRKQLMTQFLGESVLVAAIAMLLALAFVELVLPAFAGFLDADLKMRYLGEGGLILPIIGLVLLVGAAGGIYPAFYLSRFQPATVLKANKSSAEAQGSGSLRNILVVAQFAVSIGLIICTAIVYGQTAHARTADPGYKRDGLLQLEGVGRREMFPLADTLIRELKQIDGVTDVGRTNIGIATRNNQNTGVQMPGRSEPINIGNYAIDNGFFDTMGIKLLAGRTFDESRPMDDATTPFPEDPAAERALVARGLNVVLNELAVRRLGLGTPQQAVGKTIKMITNPEYGGVINANIIGVVQDSRFRSIRETIDPIIFQSSRFGQGWMLVRYNASDPARVRRDVEAVWKRIAPEIPFDAQFSDEIIGELYAAEDARAKTFAGFALLAVVVACLGLFGLAAFTAERRTKEIGIRKVLGARSRDIVRLLAWQFSKPVIIANIIAWPVAWWVMRDWLNTFDTRIALGPTPFVLAGLLALAIAIGTIAGHAIRVARANPIHALRYE